ncbi:hypothetical protein ACIO93_36205 [Streptomyces sp. NPDC087903]
MNTEPAPTHRPGFEQRRRSPLAFQPCGLQQSDVYAHRSARLGWEA